MIKRVFLLLGFLFCTVTVFAHDGQSHTVDQPEKIPYVQLSANFSVPQIHWVMEKGDNFVWFIDRVFEAQIYATVVDTQDLDAAIANTIPILSNETFGAPFIETRIGRTTGTWTVQLFKSGDSSVTAYAMLQSGQAYVVIFEEYSADYEAYQYPIRPQSFDEAQSLIAISDASMEAVQTVFPDENYGEAKNITFPNPSNTLWVQANHEGDNGSITTASFLFDDIVFVTMLRGSNDITSTLSNAFDTVFLGFVILPNNSEYLYLGLTFAAVIMLVLIGSMWLRYRNILKDMELVEQLAEE